MIPINNKNFLRMSDYIAICVEKGDDALKKSARSVVDELEAGFLDRCARVQDGNLQVNFIQFRTATHYKINTLSVAPRRESNIQFWRSA